MIFHRKTKEEKEIIRQEKEKKRAERRTGGLAIFLAFLMAFSSTAVYAAASEDDEDTDDKTSTIIGLVYNELRAMEIDWASTLRTYGTTNSAILTTEEAQEEKFWDSVGAAVLSFFQTLAAGLSYSEMIQSGFSAGDALDAYNTIVNDDTLAELLGFTYISVSTITLIPDDEDDAVLFTSEYMTAEEYVNSNEGRDDQLIEEVEGEEYGWVTRTVTLSESTVFKGTTYTETTEEGVIGPKPFEGATIDDYKIIYAIDGGNTLEIRGDPQEGYTSNAKEIASMTEVFFSQTMDAIDAAGDNTSGWTKFLYYAQKAWRSFLTWCEINNVVFLGWLSSQCGWSYTAIARDYAYPLMQYSHSAVFYLAKYIYPTRWTVTDDSLYTSEYDEDESTGRASRGGTSEEMEAARRDGSIWDSSQETTNESPTTDNNQDIGISTEGGSSNVNPGFYSSTDIYGQYGDEEWVEIAYCPDEENNGFGCESRDHFFYYWTGDPNSNTKQWWSLYTGKDGENDVSSDVSPVNEVPEERIIDGNYYAEDSCTLPVYSSTEYYRMQSEAIEGCFSYEITSSGTMDFTGNTGSVSSDLFEDDVYEYIMNSGGRSKGALGDYDGWVISSLEYTSTGFVVTLRDKFPSYQDRGYADTDGDGDLEYYNNGTVYTYTDIEYVTITFENHCDGEHTGYYCGGHLQLKIRGTVMGFSEEQMQNALEDEDDPTFIPYFLDPSDWDESTYTEGNGPTEDDVPDDEKEKYADYDLTVWDPWTKNTLTGSDFEYLYIITDSDDVDDTAIVEDYDALHDAEDLFQIDILIKRSLDCFPGYNQAELLTTSGNSGTTFFWRSWTASNMSQAVSLSLADWTDMYNLADTQTIVGGSYDLTSDRYNAADDEVQENILTLLGYSELPVLTADITDPEAEGYDGEILTAYERERIDRLRHLLYAFDTIGAVTYSQLSHGYIYDNVAGNATDCSGYVSNIWRDKIAGVTGESTMSTSGLFEAFADYIHPYDADSDCGIEPGDIILRLPTSGSIDDETGSVQASGDGAHALIYVGKFDIEAIYGDDSAGLTGEYVFTIDCSSMYLRVADLPKADYPTGTGFSSDAESSTSYADLSSGGSVENNGNSSIVYSGNVRFAARSYMQSGATNEGYTIYYIDMTALSDYTLDGAVETGEDDENAGIYGENMISKTSSNGSYNPNAEYYEGDDSQTKSSNTGIPFSASGSTIYDFAEFRTDFEFLGGATSDDYWTAHSIDTGVAVETKTLPDSARLTDYTVYSTWVSSMTWSDVSDYDSSSEDSTTSDISNLTETQVVVNVILAEAGGEGYEGMLATAIVIVNRMRSSSFPSTIYGVVTQGGGSQFNGYYGVKSGKYNYTSGDWYEEAYSALQAALSGTTEVTWNSTTYDLSNALYFYANWTGSAKKADGTSALINHQEYYYL